MMNRLINHKHDLYPIITHLIDQNAKNYLTRPALQDEQYTFTYRELISLSNKLAALLIQAHLKPGDIVAALVKNSALFPIIMLGIFKAGGVLLTIDNTLPIERKNTMLANANIRFIVSCSEDLLTSLQIEDKQMLIFTPETCQRIDTRIIKLPILDINNPAYIFFTSGSTGSPKGIIAPHKSLSHFLCWQSHRFKINHSDRCAQLTRLSFDVVLRSTLLALINGATLIFPPHHQDISSPTTLKWLIDEKITYFHAVPTLVKNWLYDLDKVVTFSSLRYIFFAGEKLPSTLLERFNHWVKNKARFINLYGPTETVLAKCYYIVPRKIAIAGTQPIGTPLPDTEILIINKENQLCSPFEDGEIVIKTPYRSFGYIDNKRPAFKQNPLSEKIDDLVYFTGDIGCYSENKTILIKGRIDDQIKINGIRIEPAEIENSLEKITDVKKAAVYVENNETTMLTAYLVMKETKKNNLTKEMVIDFLKSNVIPEMIPQQFKMIKSLPLTSSSKLDRRKLSLLPFTALPSARKKKAHQIKSVKGKRIAAIFKKILKLDSIEYDQNFFELGMDSLIAARIVYHINKALHCHLNVDELYKQKTIQNLAHQISDLSEQNIQKYRIKKQTLLPKSSFPLSVQQQQFALHQLLNPESSAYHIIYCFRYSSDLDLALIEQTLNHLIAVHPILTVNIKEKGNALVQRLSTKNKYTIMELYVNGKESIYQVLQKEASKTFQLNDAPLIRVTITHHDQETYLLFVFHHIITDGIATALFFAEFEKYYLYLKQGQHPVKETTIDTDYIRYINDYTKKEMSTDCLRFWKDYLNGYELLSLPYDYPKNKEVKSSYLNCETYRFTISAELHSILKKFSKQYQVTEFCILFTAFGILLSRYTRQDDLVIGVPFNNRIDSGFENAMGCFVNTLPVRFNYDQHQSFIKMCQGMFHLINKLTKYQTTPLSEIVKNVNLSGHLYDHPLFEVFFAYETAFRKTLSLEKLNGERYFINNEAAKFEFSFIISVSDNHLIAEIEFNRFLFNEATIARFADHYQLLLDTFMKHAVKPASSCQLFIEQIPQHKPIMNTYTGESILHFIADAVNNNPSQLAIDDHTGSISYSMMWQIVGQLANYLKTQGVAKNNIIAVLIPRSRFLIISMLAIWSRGGVYFPLDPDLPIERLKMIIDDAKPTCLIYHDSIKANILKRLMCAELKLIPYDQRHYDKLSPIPYIKHYDADSPAYLLYTSGTTGKPKGVLQTHRTLVNLFQSQHQELNKQQRLNIAQLASSAFDVSLQSITYALASNGSLYIVPSEYKLLPDQLWNFLHNKKINVIFLPPALLQLLAEFTNNVVASDLRAIITAGEALVITDAIRKLMLSLSQCNLINQYGPTETHVASSYRLLGDPREWPSYPPIGTPIENVYFTVHDHYGNKLPLGMRGELYVSGASVALGYLNRPDLSQQRFITLLEQGRLVHGYKTGDLVIRKQDGEYYFLGRIDKQLNINGYRVEPSEIEQQLLTITHVNNCIVEPQSIGGKLKIVAYYCTDNHQAIAEQTLATSLAKILPDYMVPDYYIHLKTFPFNTNGKIDKRQLPLPVQHVETSVTTPCSPLQKELLKICQSILDVENISITDNLFQIGFDSLSIARLAARLNRQYNIALPIRTIFKYPRIKELSHQIEHLLITNHTVEKVKIKKKKHPYYSLCLQQQRIVHDIQHGLNPVANNLSLAISFKGELNYEAMTLSIDSLLSTFDIFHAFTKFANNSLLIAMDNSNQSPLIHLDYSKENYSLPQWRTLLIDKAYEDLYPFDKGFYKIFLIKISPQLHILLVVIHHLIIDGLSMQFLIEQLRVRYFHYSSNLKSNYKNDLSNLSFKKYLSWQKQEADIINKSEKPYLQEILGNIASLISYPISNRPLISENKKNIKHFEITGIVHKKLKEVTKKNGISLFAILLYAYGTLIHHLSHKEDVLIGMTVSGRTHPPFAETLGLFSQRSVVLLKINSQFADKTALMHTQDAILKSLQHQHLSIYDYPDYNKFLHEKNLATPQFNIIFQNYQKAKLDFKNLNVELIDLPNKYFSHDVTDITFIIEEKQEKLDFKIYYNNMVFTSTWIKHLKDDYLQTISSIIQQIEQSFG